MPQLRLVELHPHRAPRRRVVAVVPYLPELAAVESLPVIVIALTDETAVQRHRRWLRQRRERQVITTIPRDMPRRLRPLMTGYARAVVRDTTRAELRRVRWPWQLAPEKTATPRGRQGVARAQALASVAR